MERTRNDGFKMKLIASFRIGVSERDRSIAFASPDASEVRKSARDGGFIQIPLKVFGRHGDWILRDRRGRNQFVGEDMDGGSMEEF